MGWHALIVDDSRTTRRILHRMLQKVGFENIEEAGDGVEALDRLRFGDKTPDIVLVDWNMPEMDGYRFIRLVRAKSNFDDVRLMMVTSESDIARVAQALAAGADEYVMKPFTKDIIAEKLAMLGFHNGAAA